jgi:predicted O-linked N-acetylglucosamine transferase (SPINDLY family)
LCVDLIPLLNNESHEDAWKIVNSNILELEKYRDDELILPKEFLRFQITHMFKIYFEVNTKNYTKNIAKYAKKFLPYIEYTSPFINENKYLTYKKVRVGYLSLYFHNYHSVFVSISGNLLVNRNDIEIFTFFLGEPDSSVTKVFSESVKNPIFITRNENDTKTDVEQIREVISSYKLDILIYPEIGECALIYYTAFSRLAPIQITTIGHCDTSGIPNIDYYISSELFEPDNAQEYYSEKLIKLKNIVTYLMPIYINRTYNPSNLVGWSYDDKPFKSREELGFSKDDIILHCIQTEYKFSLRFLRIIRRILENNEKAILLLKKSEINEYSKIFQNMIDTYIPNDRIRYLEWQQRYEYFNYIYISDIALMPFPFGGYCTAIDMFQMGKPVVTLDGKKLMGKMTAGLYRYMDIYDPIAIDDDEYYYIANKLCKNVYYKQNLSNRIINNAKKIFQSIESAEEFYDCLIKLAKENIDGN